MTGEETPPTAPQAPPDDLVRLDMGNVRENLWCDVCKALTGFTADVLGMHAGGVAVVGTVAGCVICMDDVDGTAVHRG
ncbi:hypothetical protein [[Kitasatospora] papulosa]|uniref:hypothetical protein n=1 Tax=[Kitasatospora] papulosa TaxID=1464011 RepID=UPI00367E9325